MFRLFAQAYLKMLSSDNTPTLGKYKFMCDFNFFIQVYLNYFLSDDTSTLGKTNPYKYIFSLQNIIVLF